MPCVLNFESSNQHLRRLEKVISYNKGNYYVEKYFK